jgi:hypothetical protein
MSPIAKTRRIATLPALLAVLLLTVGLATAPTARACMCTEPPPPAQALEQAGAVFSGRCVEVERTEMETAYGKLPKLRVLFEVKATWKGLDGGPARTDEDAGDETMRPRTVEVWTGAGGGDCGFAFEEGKSYLVYAHRAADGTLSTDICTRTRQSDRAAGDLDALGEPAWVVKTGSGD